MTALSIQDPKRQSKRGQRIYRKPPNSPHYPPHLPIDFFDSLPFKTNVKTIREGDWICFFCQNLNFSFRNECNRCQAYASVQNQAKDHSFSNFFNNSPINPKKNMRVLENEKINELFEKVCRRDEGFSNVVLIDFELKDNNIEDTFEEIDDPSLKQYETTPILQLIDE